MGPVHMDRILESFELERARDYTPSFSVKEEKRGWRLFDGDTDIAFFSRGYWYFFDIWSFSPHESPVMANIREPGAVWDVHTLHNTMVNLHYHSCRELTEGLTDLSGRVRAGWQRDSGEELHFRVEGDLAREQRLAYDILVRYDPAWGRYRYLFNADVWKLTQKGLEPINMLMPLALACRPQERRWTHSVWEDPQGNLQRFVHSNALFSVTDFTAPPDLNWKNASHPRGWIGYAANESFNPVMLIHDTNAAVHFATCSQLFDEHIIWGEAGLTDFEDGYFHFYMRAELANVGAELARQLLDAAKDPPCKGHVKSSGVALPFTMDGVNSFEESVDVWAPEECPILCIGDDDDAIQWVDDEAHSGQRSVRFTGKAWDSRPMLCPIGAVCKVESHSRYRLTAWVKTSQVERFARLRLYSYEYHYDNVMELAQSEGIRGTTDWTRIAVELDTGEEVYVVPEMLLYGPGQAWFDDVSLEKVGG